MGLRRAPVIPEPTWVQRWTPEDLETYNQDMQWVREVTSTMPTTAATVRQRGVRFTLRGTESYPTAEFLQNAANIETRPTRDDCEHPLLDRIGTNQHKKRYKCATCGGTWSGR